MSIFNKMYQSMVNAARDRYDTKLQGGLTRLNAKLKNDPRYLHIANTYLTNEKFIQQLTENFIWSVGNPSMIRDHFRGDGTSTISGSLNLREFWRVAPANKYIMVHTGFPSLISSKMVDILFGNGFDVDVKVFKTQKAEDGTELLSEDIDEDESDRIKEMVTDTIFTRISLSEKLAQAGYCESWGGHVAMKLSLNPSITPYPILEVADLRQFEVVKERGVTTAIIFKAWKTMEDGASKHSYRLDEIYKRVRGQEELAFYKQFGLNGRTGLKEGDAVIHYQLTEILENGREIPIAFEKWNVCPALTNGLREAYAFPGLSCMLAFEKPNRLPNNEFPGVPYGLSDYSKAQGSFHILDELYSENAREVRDNKGIIGRPSSMYEKDSNGQILQPDGFQTNVLIDEKDVDQMQGQKQMLQVVSIMDRTESLKEKWKIEVGQICTLCKLSPTTLAIPGFESIAADDKSQQEREKLTIDTRKSKIRLWTPLLEDLILNYLQLLSWLKETYGSTYVVPGIDNIDIDFNNCTIKVQFPDYIKTSTKERIDTWAPVRSYQLGDLETILQQIWSPLGKTDQEIKEMADKIRIENNMSIDNPSALSMEGLLNQNNQGGNT